MACIDKWRPVRLENEEGVRYLNRLFARGWYLMELGVDGLPYLNFGVPMKPLPIEFDAKNWVVARSQTIQIVILMKGKLKNAQKAVVQMRDERGYYDWTVPELDMKVWRALASIALEAEGLVTIYQRRDADLP